MLSTSLNRDVKDHRAFTDRFFGYTASCKKGRAAAAQAGAGSSPGHRPPLERLLAGNVPRVRLVAEDVTRVEQGLVSRRSIVVLILCPITRVPCVRRSETVGALSRRQVRELRFADGRGAGCGF